MKKFTPYLAAIVIFTALAVLYSTPVLKGWSLWSTDHVNAVSATQEAFDYHYRTGEYSSWTGALYCGMPNYQIGGGAPTGRANILFPLQQRLSRGNAITAMLLYFLCFFIMFLCFEVKPYLSITGSLAASLSSYLLVIIRAGHGGKSLVIPLTAVAIGAFYLIFRRKKRLPGALLTMVAISLAGTFHPQMTYYIYMLVGVLCIAELIMHIGERRLKEFALSTAVFAGATLVGLGTNCANVFSNTELMKESVRGHSSEIVRDAVQQEQVNDNGMDLSKVTGWSYGLDETFTLIIPGFKGGASGVNLGTESHFYKDITKAGVNVQDAKRLCQYAPLYWGDQPFTEGNVYVGAIVCFLFVLGLLTVKGPYKWALLAATLLSIMLAWGNNCMWLTRLFYNHFPLYSKFRAVSSILIVAGITMPLLGIMALHKILCDSSDRKVYVKPLCISFAITGGICLFFALFGGSLYDFTCASDKDLESMMDSEIYGLLVRERRELLIADSWRSLGFIAAAFVLLMVFVRGKLGKGPVAAVLSILIVADLWPVDKRYLFDELYFAPKAYQEVAAITPRPYEEMILQDKDPNFRVLNLAEDTFNENRTSYFFKSLGGYNAAKLRRYQDLIDEHLVNYDLPVINMLNAKYIIIPDSEGGEPRALLNTEAMGNAWFVDRIKIVNNATQESDALMQVDLHTTAVVDRAFEQYVEDVVQLHDYSAEVKLTDYTPRSVDYVTNASRGGIVVFSEVYYPHGWKVTIDGEEADHFRADYILRAMKVPAGRHEIHFEFDPESVRMGNALSAIFCIIMYLTAAAAMISYIRYRKKNRI